MSQKITSELLKSIGILKTTIESTQKELNKIAGQIDKINKINQKNEKNEITEINNSHEQDAGSVNGSGQKLAVEWILESAKLIKQNCSFIQQSDINSKIVDLKNDVNNVKVAYNNAKGLLKLNELDSLIETLVDTAKLQVDTLLFYNKFVNRLCTVTP